MDRLGRGIRAGTGRVGTGRGGYGGVMSQWQTAQAGARQANIARQARIEKMYDEMMASVGPGGAFEKAGLGQIERAKTKGVGQEMQQMISSGLYGTTTAAGIGRGWESEVGAPARLRLEDIMEQRRLGLKERKAGFLERIEEPYPDYGALMSAMGQPGAVGGGVTTVSGGGPVGGPAYLAFERSLASEFGKPFKARKPGAGYYGDY